jgi:hypothetical protein
LFRASQIIDVGNGTVFVSTTGVVTFAPDSGYSGTLVIPYTVVDSGGLTDTANITVNVTPKSSTDTSSTPAGTATTITPLTNDSGTGLEITSINGTTVVVGTPINITDASGNVIGTVTVNSNGSVTVTPAPGYSGPIVLNYTATDDSGQTTSSVVTVNVVAAVEDIVETSGNTPITTNPLGNDNLPDGSAITSINGVTPVVGVPISVPNGTVVLNPDGTITIVPNNGYIGVITFPYQATTPDGTVVGSTITVNVVSLLVPGAPNSGSIN